MSEKIVTTLTGSGPRQVRLRIRHGQGPAVLLMSGAAQTSGFWRPVIEELPGRLMASFDRPGMGGTPWPGHLPTLAEEVETAVGLVRRLGEPVVLAAHSMAAFHAEALIREHPLLVSGLVLVDPSVEWQTRPPSVQGTGLARTVRAAAGSGLAGLGEICMTIETLMQTTWSAARLGQYLRVHRVKDVYGDPESLAMATAEVMAYSGQAWDLMEVRSDRPWPGAPTIVLSAENSHAEQEADRQRRLAVLLGAQLRTVPGSRHLMMLDAPQAIADLS